MARFCGSKINRRDCLGSLAGAAAAGWLSVSRRCLGGDETLPPVRTITSGPRHHWFGYYDKFEFDPTNRFVLGLEANFEHRMPRPDDAIGIGMVDLQDGDRWISLGETRAWNWQQGCMLQWIPGSKTKVLWNDREDDRFVCRVFDVGDRNLRTIPHSIYTLRHDGRQAIGLDFRRLHAFRPVTGYAGVTDPFADQRAPRESGLWRVDLESGERRLIFSLAEIAEFGDATAEMQTAWHFLEHPTYSPDGSRFAFLHRWRPQPRGGSRSRLLTATPDGKDLFVVDGSGKTSHLCWRDPRHLLAWTQPAGKPAGFYLFRDQSDFVELVGKDVMTENGHCTYLPGAEWILNDTYPDERRLQHPYLYHVGTGRRAPLGHFHSPPEYKGNLRCDTHPRFSRDGRMVVIDSPTADTGRQLHLIDISGIVG